MFSSHDRIRYNLYIVCFLAALGLLMSGCGKSPQDPSIIAKVGQSVITVDDFNDRVKNLPAQYQEVIRKRKRDFLDEIINDQLLYDEAVKEGLDNDPEVQKVFKAAKTKILIAKYLKDHIDDKLVVTDQEIADYYNDNKDHYMVPEMMRAAHILTDTREKAEAILGELSNGSDFSSLARAKSLDPTAQNGGDIGYFYKGQLMPEFEKACASLSPGEISDVVKTKLGYHIIKLLDRKPPEYRPLEKVKDNIAAELRKKKKREMFNGILDELKSENEIIVNEDVLDESGDKTQRSQSI